MFIFNKNIKSHPIRQLISRQPGLFNLSSNGGFGTNHLPHIK